MRILVIEDDERAVMYLHKGLSEAGYVVESALNGEDGLEMATTRPYDPVMLDVMLPRLDGWSVIANLRQRADTPVIFLTARDAVSDRIRGLDLGADDYQPKPYAFSELLARIRTVLRRGAETDASGACIIRVSDNGCGIAPEHLPRLFDRLYQVDPDRPRSLKGAGLGLSIVKSIMDLHRGGFVVDSAPSKGSTFTLHFPAQAAGFQVPA